MSEKWKKNPLFRLLAFLDIVGLQTFSVKNDITDDGVFIEANRTFSPDSVIHKILTHGLHSLHANIKRLFLVEEEQKILLQFIGDPNEASSSFCQGLLKPSSLTSFLDIVENELPVWALIRIKEVFGLLSSSTTITEQFLIDALDDWMQKRTPRENDAMVLSCGVQPDMLDSARARADELPNAVEDFIIDVVFPPPYPSTLEVKEEEEEKEEEGSKEKKGDKKKHTLLDWLIEAYEKCHEIIDVEEEEIEEEEEIKNEDGKESPIESTMKKRRKEEEEKEEESEEEYLTADNIDRFMRERPSVIPKEILREKRRSLQDAGITDFELQNHYTVNELSVFVKEKIGEGRRLKKAECIRAILNYHRIVMKKESSAFVDTEQSPSEVV
ncbi:uncharacterized protein TM35_000093090 [Trypanosoma theileri]|uniref:Uncharacterized protein n=1 Tax=Trypanosoma theileri TaxID=67003 RepID=A0A1X0P158_9TRYP|nr:uncharacterized protein TM35_000093090 [Trypanosoma theileri]ORC90259.1 hypothetical protein TM35_000093090 [Trypanosoma theileri]